MKRDGFSYIEVLVSMVLLLGWLLLMGEMNMTSLNLIGKGKINQRATLILFDKIEELRAMPIENLTAGEFDQEIGLFTVQWRIEDHVPYFGTKQIRCRVIYNPAAAIVVESLFYRSE